MSRLKNFTDPLLDAVLRVAPLTVVARSTHRALWQAHYTGRDEVDERQVGWEDVPRKGMNELRLICPDGQVAVLGNRGSLMLGPDIPGVVPYRLPGDISERAFHVGQAARGPDGYQRFIDLIGVVTGPDDRVLCYAWDYRWRMVAGEMVPPHLVGPFADHFYRMECGGNGFPIGCLNPEVLGVRAP